jgi:hypothetical protein
LPGGRADEAVLVVPCAPLPDREASMSPSLIHLLLLSLTAAPPAASELPVIRMLWSLDLQISPSGTAPLLLDGCSSRDCGGLLISASRWRYGIPFADGYDRWSIEVCPGGEPAACTGMPPASDVVISAAAIDPGSDDQYLLALSPGGDTLWTCRLEGTDEFCHSPRIFGLGEDGYAACITPDCNGNLAGIYRISPCGECLFASWIEHWWLLGMPEAPGEAGPRIASACRTPSGGLLLAGEVSEWMTTPLAWFACMIDGITGEPVWRASGFGLGQAFLSDAVTTGGGLTVAVGATALCSYEDGPVPGWEGIRPMIVLLGPSGDVLQTIIFEDGPAGALEGITACPGASGRFVAAMSLDDTDRMVLMAIEMPDDPSAWTGAGAAVVEGWPGSE